jgi:hypothetical protein
MPNPRGALLQAVFLSMIIHGCQHSIHGRLFFYYFICKLSLRVVFSVLLLMSMLARYVLFFI